MHDRELTCALCCTAAPGLPFPAAYDPHVKLQRQLLDEEARAGSRGVCGGKGLTGEQW